jgi:8-oxo-dGTP diphosphatase
MSGAPTAVLPPVAAEVALGLCTDPKDRVLLLLRPRDPYGGLWSLPGGKREGEEGLADACRRELREELGRAVEVGGLRLLVDETLEPEDGGPPSRWIVAVFACRVPADGGGLPPGVAWVPREALDGLELIPTDRLFLDDALRPGPYARFRQARVRLRAGRPEVLSYG